MTGMSSKAVTVERGISNGGRKCRRSRTISSRKATSSTPTWTTQNRHTVSGRRNLPAASWTRPVIAPVGVAMSALAIVHSQQPDRDSPDDRLGARSHAQLGVDVVAVPVHGTGADAQLCRDLPVVKALGEKRQDRKLTLAQVGRAMSGLTRGEQQPGRQTGLEHARPAGYGSHRLDQLLARGGLAQVSRGPGLQGATDVLVLVIRADHQDPYVRVVTGEPAGDLDAIHPRKPDVHQHHVGAKLVDQRQGDLAGAGVTDNL